MAVGTPASLAAGLNVTDASSFVTAAFTPTATAKLLAYVCVGHRTITPSFPSSLSGHSVTWTKVVDVTTSNNIWNCSVWEAVASGSPSSGTLTFNLAATAETCTWRVVEATDAQIRQTKTLATSAVDPSLTLDNAIGSGGVVLGFLMNSNATTTLTAGSGYTDIGTQQSSATAPVFKQAAEYDMTGATVVAYTAAGTVVRALIGLELGPAGTPATMTTVVGTATAAGGSASLTGAATLSGAVGGAPAAGGSATLTGAARMAATVGAATASGGSATLIGAGVMSGVAGSATASGGVATMSGGGPATMTTVVGQATAAGGLATSSGAAKMTTIVGAAVAAGGTASSAGAAVFGTTAGQATAAGGVATMSGGAASTLTGLTGTAQAVGGVASLTGAAICTTLAGQATAAGRAALLTGAAILTGAGGQATASGGVAFMVGGTPTVIPVGARSTGRLVEAGHGHLTTPAAHGRLLGPDAARFLTATLEGELV